MLKKNKSKKGITLVALVITIIIMLIIVGVSIAIAIKEEGLFQYSSKASISTEIARNRRRC